MEHRVRTDGTQMFCSLVFSERSRKISITTQECGIWKSPLPFNDEYTRSVCVALRIKVQLVVSLFPGHYYCRVTAGHSTLLQTSAKHFLSEQRCVFNAHNVIKRHN